MRRSWPPSAPVAAFLRRRRPTHRESGLPRAAARYRRARQSTLAEPRPRLPTTVGHGSAARLPAPTRGGRRAPSAATSRPWCLMLAEEHLVAGRNVLQLGQPRAEDVRGRQHQAQLGRHRCPVAGDVDRTCADTALTPARSSRRKWALAGSVVNRLRLRTPWNGGHARGVVPVDRQGADCPLGRAGAREQCDGD